jgi:cytochrome c oxidase subunit II
LQAQNLKQLIWLMIGVCALVWLAVVLVLAATLWRRRPSPQDPLSLDTARERRMGMIVGASVAATVAIITGFTLISFFATRGLSRADESELQIDVKGYQWWWEVTYPDAHSDQAFLTANEIHVPVGRPIRIRLSAADVIHSFWVPNLTGKLDLIPGRDNELTFTAQRPGVYRGQCAEFCGLQHAHMAFLVIADEPEAFDRWRAEQVAPAAAPASKEQQAGFQTFQDKGCAGCHAIRGTAAKGTHGPDLTHIASRRYIAAGLLETTRGSLAAWIADPQNLKPGNNMPMVALSADELKAVSAYMANLN